VDDHRLEKIRLLIAKGDWIPSQHVREDYLETGECTLDDIECSILTGEIVAVQKDEVGGAVDGHKYVIQGRSRCGMGFETVGKIIKMADGKRYFVITAYNYRSA